MSGMPSARGLEWKQRTGDGSHKRYQDNMEKFFPGDLKCLNCLHEKKNKCTHVLAPEDNKIQSVVKAPEWCPAKREI